jgi:hypothetical protein
MRQRPWIIESIVPYSPASLQLTHPPLPCTIEALATHASPKVAALGLVLMWSRRLDCMVDTYRIVDRLEPLSTAASGE